MILKAEEIKSIQQNLDGTYNVVMKKSQNGFRFFTTPWQDIPRYNKLGEQISPEEFKREIVDKYGLIYFNQNYACEFLGSSDTLIDAEILKNLEVQDPIEIKDRILNIYKEPEKDHKYILTVDSAKDGKDSFAIQVVDVTTIVFDQVASANLQCNYLTMPEHVYDFGKYYNNALIIIENNEGSGQSIADMLLENYEYENLYYDVERKPSSYGTRSKTYPGFRTTTKTRKVILNNLKMFVDSEKFIIRDSRTIKELTTFIYVNGKYQADQGFHDDSVMSLALVFAPFTDAQNFVDIKKMLDTINSDEEPKEEFSLKEFLDIAAFDDFSDEESKEKDIFLSEDEIISEI